MRKKFTFNYSQYLQDKIEYITYVHIFAAYFKAVKLKLHIPLNLLGSLFFILVI